jgi:NAD(P)H-hydrate repair Nnr-like enzyme with NAD(P)H-hydrate dehydratase domain
MSDYNTPNFKRQGGAVWVIGGDVQITGGKFLNATGAQAAAIANSTGTGDVVAKFNLLLAAARNLGIIAT